MKYWPLLVTLVFLLQDAYAFERTEQRQPCADYQLDRKPLFGDLHIHTRYSFDAYVSSLRQDPSDAYRYAKGAPLQIPAADGVSFVKSQLNRPLDFAAVTDHGEFLGQIGVCTEDSSELGYWWPHCSMTRSTQQWVQLYAADWWTGLSGQKEAEKSESFACTLSDCR
ncbi:MAG: DUF3604 domain-containing protein, partial [Pseudomonadales bacterium]|nr:DUF3604 domain-containing protein [Pseudomonadales bacterium]